MRLRRPASSSVTPTSGTSSLPPDEDAVSARAWPRHAGQCHTGRWRALRAGTLAQAVYHCCRQEPQEIVAFRRLRLEQAAHASGPPCVGGSSLSSRSGWVVDDGGSGEGGEELRVGCVAAPLFDHACGGTGCCGLQDWVAGV